MEELKVYSVSDTYIEYLRRHNPNVYSNKVANRTHTRKYIGVVIELAGYKYYIPMSSPKDTDYQVADKSKVIKKSIVPIIRMVIKNSKGDIANAQLLYKQKKANDQTAGYVKTALDYSSLERLCEIYKCGL